MVHSSEFMVVKFPNHQIIKSPKGQTRLLPTIGRAGRHTGLPLLNNRELACDGMRFFAFAQNDRANMSDRANSVEVDTGV
jgi:hypothetical protein